MTQMESITSTTKSDDDGFDRPPTLPSFKRGVAWTVLLAALFFVCAFTYAAIFGFYTAISQPELFKSGDSEALSILIVDHLLSDPSSIFGLMLVQCLVFIPVLFLISNFRLQDYKQTLALRSFSKYWLVRGVILFIAYTILAAVVEWLMVSEVDEFILLLNGSRSFKVAFAIVVLAPICEELIFRGYLFKVLRPTWLGASGTIVLSSALFMFFHYGQYQWPILVSIFLFSILLGYLREKSGSVYLPMIMHALNNLISAVYVVYLGMA